MKKGYCKLCRSEQNLCKAHIFPDFFYRTMYDEKHRIFGINPDRFSKERKYSTFFTGEYDDNILCQVCDGEIIGTYEKYAREALFGGLLNNVKVTHYKDENEKTYVILENIDYEKFKLFLLSMIYKMSISHRPNYKKFTIGDHEQVVRKMIYEGDPGEQHSYPIIIASFMDKFRPNPDIIAAPIRFTNKQGFEQVRVYVYGLIINYILPIEGQEIPDEYKFMMIKKSNEMCWLKMTYQQGLDSLMNTLFKS